MKNKLVLLPMLLWVSLNACSNEASSTVHEATASLTAAAASATHRALITLSPEQEKGVVTEPLQQAQAVPRSLSVGATVEMSPGGAAVLSAPEAARVVRIDVEPGQSVQKGQALMQLDASAVAVARAEIQRGKAISSRASQLVEQEQKLADLNATNQRDRTLAKQELAVAQADLASAYSRLKAWGTGGGRGSSVVLRAPMKGIVSELNVVPGTLADSGSILLRILDPAAWNLRVWVPQAWASRVAEGDLQVALPGESIAACLAQNLGHLHRVDPELHAVPFRAKPAADCAGRLFEGATVEVRVPLRGSATDASLYQAKSSAVSTYQGQPVVFVQQQNSSTYRALFIRDLESWGDYSYFRFSPDDLGAITAETRVATSSTVLLKGELMRGELE